MITLTIKTYQILIKHLKREEKKDTKHLLNDLAYQTVRGNEL